MAESPADVRVVQLDVKTIGKHINNALNEELAGEPVVAKFATARKYGRVEGLYQERYLYGPGGEKRIANNTLVALTLMIAESRTEEMDIIVKVVVNLINRENTGI